MADYRCPYGYGWCEVPYKDCPHWQGTFCELDVEVREDAFRPSGDGKGFCARLDNEATYKVTADG